MNTIETEDRLGITFCNRQPVSIERGEGCRVWDESGNEYLDFTSGWGVTCLGHSHPVITDAIFKQAQKIIQNPNSGFTYSPPRARLLRLLSEVMPMRSAKIYFANSGAEANDVALKLARKITNRTKIVSTLGSFHGRTLNTLSVSGGKQNAERFLPILQGNRFVPFGDISQMREAIDEHTAAVIVEPIQGEGGVRIPDADYLVEVAALCKRYGVLLIVDEIQTGFCRTGKFFALEHCPSTVSPDMLTMGKGIAGGFPFAAFAVSERVSRLLEKGDHGGTFCGNPLACAVAAAVVELLQKQRIADSVAILGKLLLGQLQRIAEEYPSVVRSVRGKGLLCAIEMHSDAQVSALTEAALQRGLLVTPTRNRVVRLIPPLTLSELDLRLGLSRLESAMASVVPDH